MFFDNQLQLAQQIRLGAGGFRRHGERKHANGNRRVDVFDEIETMRINSAEQSFGNFDELKNTKNVSPNRVGKVVGLQLVEHIFQMRANKLRVKFGAVIHRPARALSQNVFVGEKNLD